MYSHHFDGHFHGPSGRAGFGPGAVPRVGVVYGEDSSPGVVAATVDVMRALRADIEFVEIDVTDDAVMRKGIDSTSATLFGATSGPSVPALFHLRWGRQTFANVRPVRYLPGAVSPLADPRGIDFVIVRENLEDLYAGLEGDLADLGALDLRDRVGEPLTARGPGAYAIKVITEARTAEVARAAFALARHRADRLGRPGRVTTGTKHNLLARTDGLFLSVVRDVAAEFPDVRSDALIVDDLAHRLVTRAHDFDVILLPNLYGDILSDLAAGLVGGMGVVPSACYGHDYAYFEPCHGTAPDLAGLGVANPTAQMLSAAMLLEHLGQGEAAARLVGAIERTYREGAALTPDQGGTARTERFAEAVVADIQRGG